MRRVGVLAVVLVAGCTAGGSRQEPPGARDRSMRSSPTARAAAAPLPVSSTEVQLPGRCAATEVAAKLGEFLSDLNARDAIAVVDAFDPAGFLWEAGGHFDPPNGTLGGMRTPSDVEGFMRELDVRGERWVDGSVISPVGDANLPAETGFGLGFTTVRGGVRRDAGAKVVISCDTGLITHMAGPSL